MWSLSFLLHSGETSRDVFVSSYRDIDIIFGETDAPLLMCKGVVQLRKL